MFGVFKLNSYFCNGIKYRLMVHVNENDCNVPLCSIETSIKYETFSLISSNILHHIDFFPSDLHFSKNNRTFALEDAIVCRQIIQILWRNTSTHLPTGALSDCSVRSSARIC